MTTNKKDQPTPKQFDLGKDFGAAIIHVNGISIGIQNDGTFCNPTDIAKNQSTKTLDFGNNPVPVKILANGSTLRVSVAPKSEQAPANDAATPGPATKSAVTPDTRIGDIMPDGSIYAGLAPDTFQHTFIPQRHHYSRASESWYDAQKAAANCDAHGHHDWQLPLASTLEAIFNQAALKLHHAVYDGALKSYISRFDGEYHWALAHPNDETATVVKPIPQPISRFQLYCQSSLSFPPCPTARAQLPKSSNKPLCLPVRYENALPPLTPNP